MRNTDPDPKPEQLTLSLLITRRRSEMTLTQAKIANHLGIKSPEYIGLVEHGKRGMDLNKIPLLADVLGFDSGDLVKVYMHEIAPRAYDSLFSLPPTYPRDIQRKSDTAELLDLYEQLDHGDKIDLLDRLRKRTPNLDERTT